MERTLDDARRLAWCFAAVSTCAVVVLLQFSKISFVYSDLGSIGFLFSVFLLPSVYFWRRGWLRAASSFEAIALVIFMAMPIVASNYLAASLDRPLMDETLQQMDAALGFNWLSFIKFVDSSRFLAHSLNNAYMSFIPQLFALPLILGATGRYERCYQFVLSYAVICYVSSTISIWFPALAMYATSGISQGSLHNIDVTFGFLFLDQYEAVRNQAQFFLSPHHAKGIVTFPSVHVAVALLCAWAVWDLKLPIRLFFLVLNVLMAAAAVTHGSHYLIDVIAGLIVAAVSIPAVRTMVSIWSKNVWLHRAQALVTRVRSRSAAWISPSPSTTARDNGA